MMFYKTKAWKKLRAAVLRRDGYKSKLAARCGKNIEADTVHHVLPVEFFPEYRLKEWNLISLTREEHNRLHDRDTHGLTEEGLALARRVALRQGLDVHRIMTVLSVKNGKCEGNDCEKENES